MPYAHSRLGVLAFASVAFMLVACGQAATAPTDTPSPSPTKSLMAGTTTPTTQPSAVGAPVPTDELTELDYTISCDVAGSDWPSYTDYRDAWSTPSDYCTTDRIDGPPSETQLKAVELLEGKSADKMRPSAIKGALEFLVSACATSGKKAYNYLKADGVDRIGQAEEWVAILTMCPDHPDAQEINKRIDAILADRDERGEFIYNGSYRIGKDIEPGTYVSEGNDGEGCYWELADSSGQTIDNGFALASRVEVTIPSSAYEFISDFCAPWRRP